MIPYEPDGTGTADLMNSKECTFNLVSRIGMCLYFYTYQPQVTVRSMIQRLKDNRNNADKFMRRCNFATSLNKWRSAASIEKATRKYYDLYYQTLIIQFHSIAFMKFAQSHCMMEHKIVTDLDAKELNFVCLKYIKAFNGTPELTAKDYSFSRLLMESFICMVEAQTTLFEIEEEIIKTIKNEN